MQTLYRIVHGELTPDELAALTVVLMARVAGDGSGGHAHRRQRRTHIRWHRLGTVGNYRSPVSWRDPVSR